MGKHIDPFRIVIGSTLANNRDIVFEYVTKYTDTDDDMGFLIQLSKKKNWKEDCFICLDCTVRCDCGHTSTSVFTPCGHTLCTKPCFTEFREKKGLLKMKPNIFKMISMDSMVQIKPEYEPFDEFDCPVCRQTVERKFIAEDVQINSKMKIDEMVEKVMNYIK